MTDIKKMSEEELKQSVADKRLELRAFRFGGAGSRTRNVREGRTIRKTIARFLTEMRDREITSKAKSTQ